MDEKASAKISNMSLLCALLVVSIHVGFSREGCLAWLLSSSGVTRVAVPFFFLSSGYFLSAHFDERGWWCSEMRKRIGSLFVPYVVWIVVHTILFSSVAVAANYMHSRAWWTNVHLVDGRWPSVIGVDFSRGPLLAPLWYVRSLFIIVLLSPLIRWCCRRIPLLWIGLLIVLQVCVLSMEKSSVQGFLKYGLSVFGVHYFSLGVILRNIRKVQIPKFLGGLSGTVGIVLFMVATYCLQDAVAFNLVRTMAIPLTMYGLWSWMPTRSLPHVLQRQSFPIFVLHIIVLNGWWMASKKMTLDVNTYAFLSLGVAVCGSIAIAHFLRLVFPKFAKLAFGGR